MAKGIEQSPRPMLPTKTIRAGALDVMVSLSALVAADLMAIALVAREHFQADLRQRYEFEMVLVPVLVFLIIAAAIGWGIGWWRMTSPPANAERGSSVAKAQRLVRLAILLLGVSAVLCIGGRILFHDAWWADIVLRVCVLSCFVLSAWACSGYVVMLHSAFHGSPRRLSLHLYAALPVIVGCVGGALCITGRFEDVYAMRGEPTQRGLEWFEFWCGVMTAVLLLTLLAWLAVAIRVGVGIRICATRAIAAATRTALESGAAQGICRTEPSI